MSRIKSDAVYELLVDLIVFDERQWLREVATTVLRSVNQTRAASSANGLSKDPRWEIRRASAGLLLGQSDEPSVEIARRLANDADQRVRLAAIPALAGAPQPLSEVLGDLLDADDPRLQVAVARALAWRLSLPEIDAEQRDEAFALLDARWAVSADASVQGELLDAAARAGAVEPVREFLARALDVSDRRVRLKAIGHLKELFGEDRSDAAGGPSERPLEDYVEILRWASEPKAAVVTVEREGFIPGRFTIRLHTDSAPLTSWTFAQMVDEGLFTGRRFSRVLPGFIAQHRDPDAVDRPGVGHAALSEPSADWFREGTLAMVTPAPGLAGPEWFYTLKPQPQLLARYTPFANAVQNLTGVAARVLPGDYVISIEIYDGDGTEPLR
jgi:cyclophilin family peptidyl-prolyl cis-trans isomerase